MDQPTVLIVSDDAEFSRTVASRWQTERTVPAFTLMGGDLCQSMDGEDFELAIVSQVGSGRRESVLAALELSGKPIIFVSSDAVSLDPQSGRAISETHARVMVLRDYEGWLDALVLLGSEALRRSAATARARIAERENRSLAQDATLGRYVLEMRHTVNNALTSVLGNSELLLAEPGTLSAPSRAQIETIRNMALRIHEILQRLSSLEKELSFVDRHAEPGVPTKSRVATASL